MKTNFISSVPGTTKRNYEGWGRGLTCLETPKDYTWQSFSGDLHTPSSFGEERNATPLKMIAWEAIQTQRLRNGERAGRERIFASLIHIFKTLPSPGTIKMIWIHDDVIKSGDMAAGYAQILSFLGFGISFSHKTLHTIALKNEWRFSWAQFK